MKRGIIILIFIVLLSSFISADIIFTQQPGQIYSLGDTISIPVMVKTVRDVSGLLQMDLICNGTAVNFYKNGVNLLAGKEKNFDSSLVLTRGNIGNSKGKCNIRAILYNEEYAVDDKLSNEFKISDLLNIEASLQKTEFNPGESIAIAGKVTRETGQNSNGFVEADIVSNGINQNIIQFGIVTAGNFDINLSLLGNLKAGSYSLRIRASEKNSDGITTNEGIVYYTILVRQVPTNLELIMENREVTPGKSLKAKTILHDQTGENIASKVSITIKNAKNKILEQKEINTDESFEYTIKSNEPSAEYRIFAASNKLTAEDEFLIGTNEEVSVEVLDKTILVTNIGNVPYNKTLLVKVGDTSLSIDIILDVGQSKKYALSAPDGKYNVVISSGEGEVSGFMGLTGGAVNIKEARSYGILAWIFLSLVAGMIILMLFRKVYKKPFFGHTTPKNKKSDSKNMEIISTSDAARGNKAEISLSIKGEKQDASVICLRIKDLREMKSRKGSASETIQKIINLAEENKAVTYENQDYLFFILAPTKTRTFKNERVALQLAENIDNLLSEHNKMFNQKIDFGISLNYGAIVAKLENRIFKFMSMGTLITAAKKIAHLSKAEVLLSDKMNDLLRLVIRTEKHVRDGIPVFSVKEIKRENEEAKKFIDRFLSRQGK